MLQRNALDVQHMRLLQRGHGSRGWLFVDHGDFADDLAGVEHGQFSIIASYTQLAAEQDDERSDGLAFADENSAGSMRLPGSIPYQPINIVIIEYSENLQRFSH